MEDYQSSYTGQEIDAGIGKANTAVQPQDLPDEVTESTVAGWGFTKNTGDYSKPSGGIPATDLSQAVQTILEKANATNLTTYEFNETDLGQTVLNYIATNNPDLLKVTTQQGAVQDYYKGQDKEYYCYINGYFIVLTITGSEGSYNLDVKSYYFDDFSEVRGTNDGTNWSTITIDGTTKNIPAPIADYEIYAKSISEIDQTVLAYVYTNLPYRLRITDGDLVEDYVRMYTSLDTPMYFCIISASLVTLEIIKNGNTYSTDTQRYALTDITSVSGQNDGTNWTSLTIGNITKAIPSGGGGQLQIIKQHTMTSSDSGDYFEWEDITSFPAGTYYFVTTDPTSSYIGCIEFPVCMSDAFSTSKVIRCAGTVLESGAPTFDVEMELVLNEMDNGYVVGLLSGASLDEGITYTLYYKSW